MKLIDNLNNIKPDDHIVLFLRHGNRDKIPDGEFGNEIELNETGLLRSKEYGIQIRHLQVNRIFSSPVRRCIQTAEKIKEGLHKDVPIILSTLLGEPGMFVDDGSLAGASYLELGNHNTYYSLLEGKSIPGFRSLQEGADLFNTFIRQQDQEAGINLYVSHDMIIALYAYTCFGKRYTFEDWVKYLEGPVIHLNP